MAGRQDVHGLLLPHYCKEILLSHEVESVSYTHLSNYHYHKVSADSEETLDMIEEVLRQKEILIETA